MDQKNKLNPKLIESMISINSNESDTKMVRKTHRKASQTLIMWVLLSYIVYTSILFVIITFIIYINVEIFAL